MLRLLSGPPVFTCWISFALVFSFIYCRVFIFTLFPFYEGGSICNENPFITPSTNALGSYAICQTKDQSLAVKMVHRTLFYLSKFNKLHTF